MPINSVNIIVEITVNSDTVAVKSDQIQIIFSQPFENISHNLGLDFLVGIQIQN
jgi:hypothetical protein